MRLLARFLGRLRPRRRVGRGRVAILRLYGPINGGSRSADWVESARRLRVVRNVPAVVLDIDSPGGGAAASDYLYLALARLADAKPLVAHVRGAGASGAYLAAMAARRIVVAPNSLVGSIGVLSVAPRVQDLLARLGVQVHETKAGALKGAGAPWRDATPDEQAKEDELVAAYYEAFIGRVADGRGMTRERVRELATGEIWLGSRAVELGLADETGDLERAIEVAATMAGVPPRAIPVRVRRPMLARLVDRFATRVAARLGETVEAELWGRGPRL